MTYFLVKPEVPGCLGDRSIVDYTKIPNIVTYLHYEFEAQPEDQLIAKYPVYLVTPSLAERLLKNELEGFELKDVEQSASDIFEDLYPGETPKKFVWLNVVGIPGKTDLGVTGFTASLILSERALQVIHPHCPHFLKVKPWDGQYGMTDPIPSRGLPSSPRPRTLPGQ